MDPAVDLARDIVVAQIDDPGARASVPSLAALRTAAPSAQKCLSSLVYDATLASIMRTDTRNAARLHAVCLPHAHAWLTALPLTDRLRVPATEFRQAARYRLGICDHSTVATCHECRGAPLGPYHDHALICPGRGDSIIRHNRLVAVVRRHLALAGFAPRTEEPHLLAGTARRPADVYVPCDSDGLPLAIDVTVTSPVSGTALPRAAFAAGHAAAAAELRKRVQNDASCAQAGIRFLPLAVETFGGFGPAATRFLHALASRVADRSGNSRAHCRAALFQELSVCLQRGNAHMLVRRSPLLSMGT